MTFVMRMRSRTKKTQRGAATVGGDGSELENACGGARIAREAGGAEESDARGGLAPARTLADDDHAMIRRLEV